MASLDKKFKPKHKLSFHTIMNKGVHWIPQNAQRYTYIYIYVTDKSQASCPGPELKEKVYCHHYKKVGKP